VKAEVPRLETIEVVGILAGVGFVAYLIYNLTDWGKSAADYLGGNNPLAKAITPPTPGLDQLNAAQAAGKTPTWGDQFSAAAQDVPNPLDSMISAGKTVYNWALPSRGVDTGTPAPNQVQGTGQNGAYYDGNETDVPWMPYQQDSGVLK
jgi:hypothetical protein